MRLGTKIHRHFGKLYCIASVHPKSSISLLVRLLTVLNHSLPPKVASLISWPLCLTRSALEFLAEEKELNLIVDGENTGTSDTSQNVGACALEQRPDALLGNDLASSVHRGRVFDSLFETD